MTGQVCNVALAGVPSFASPCSHIKCRLPIATATSILQCTNSMRMSQSATRIYSNDTDRQLTFPLSASALRRLVAGVRCRRRTIAGFAVRDSQDFVLVFGPLGAESSDVIVRVANDKEA